MHTLSLILHPICTHLKGKCTHLNRKCTHPKGQMHPFIAVVTTGCIDYDLTTTHGTQLPRFALFCKKCSLQLNSVIDARYNSKKPVIITTNLPLKTINNPGDVAHKRSYDRISEMCVPVLFEGESLRKAIGEEKKKQFIEQGQCSGTVDNTMSDEGGILR